MTPLPRPSSIRPCSALSRSFLLGPFGPAGAPPGQRLRSGSYMAANEAGQASKISSIKVSTLSGEPRRRQPQGADADRRRVGSLRRQTAVIGAL